MVLGCQKRDICRQGCQKPLWVVFGMSGYQFKPGHAALSMTCREDLTALPGHGQLVNL